MVPFIVLEYNHHDSYTNRHECPENAVFYTDNLTVIDGIWMEKISFLVKIFHRFLSIIHPNIEIHLFQFLEYNGKFQIRQYVQFRLIPDFLYFIN